MRPRAAQFNGSARSPRSPSSEGSIIKTVESILGNDSQRTIGSGRTTITAFTVPGNSRYNRTKISRLRFVPLGFIGAERCEPQLMLKNDDLGLEYCVPLELRR